jgi:RNA polymerase sigma-70 factor (ECF subfamily)
VSLANEKSLISELKNGSEKAFKTLVLTYQDRILNTCLGFVPNLQDAEDLSQEVFVEVYRSVQGFREDAKLSTWMYRIASTKCLEYLRNRRRAKRGGLLQILSLEKVSVEIPLDHPGIQMEQKERAKVLFDSIRRLPDNQAAAVVFSRMEGLSNKEIASIMETTVSAVESLLVRAKRNLKTDLTNFFKNEIT